MQTRFYSVLIGIVVFVIVWLIRFSYLQQRLSSSADASNKSVPALLNNRATNIHIFNSWPIGTKIEVKCDWDNKIQGYKFYKVIFVARRNNNTLSIPTGLENCEIWVLKIFL